MRSFGFTYRLYSVVGQPRWSFLTFCYRICIIYHYISSIIYHLSFSIYVVCEFYVLKSNPQPYISVVPPFVIAVLVS